MYGKIFASMFKGSLYGRWEAIVTFTVMIVLADQEGEVDMTPEALAAGTSIPLDIIRRGIEYLEAPDPQSRTPDEEGRRIIRVSDSRDWGWRITNYAHYRAIRTAEERREYFKQHKRKQRAKAKKGPPVSTESPQSPPIAVSSREKEKEEREAVLAQSFADEDHRTAYRTYRAAHRSPDALDSLLSAESAGRGWVVIGTALHEMRQAGATFSKRTLLGFAAKVGVPNGAQLPAPYRTDPFCPECGQPMGKLHPDDLKLVQLHAPTCSRRTE